MQIRAMAISRLLMIVGLTLLPIGFIYGITMHGEPGAMAVELCCLAAGAIFFLAGRLVEKKR